MASYSFKTYLPIDRHDFFSQFKFLETDSSVQDLTVNSGVGSPVKVVFTPARAGWESAKLVIKLKAEQGPTLKTCVGLHGFGGFPSMTWTRDGRPLDRDVLQLGLLRLGEPVGMFQVTNSGDAAGFASLRVFEDPYQQRPVEEVSVVPDRLVLAPGQAETIVLKADPYLASTGHRSIFLVAYVGAEMGRQVQIFFSCRYVSYSLA